MTLASVRIVTPSKHQNVDPSISDIYRWIDVSTLQEGE
jgi:hypothetical protein